MKKISQLVVSLLLINVSYAMGMNQLAVKSEKKKSLIKPSHEMYRPGDSKKLELARMFVGSQSYLSLINSGSVFGSELSCDTVFCNSTMMNLFRVSQFFQTLGLAYEFLNLNQNPPITISKKNRIFLTTSFVSSAIAFACLSMTDCPPDIPHCIRVRELFCLLNLMVVAGRMLDVIKNDR